MPRKSAVSTTATDPNGDVSMISNVTTTSTPQHAHPKTSRQSGGGKQDGGAGIDELLLPRTLVSRLARGVLPPNTSLQKDAVLALSKSATVFISYLAHHANEQSTKKTLAPQDVLKALREIEMDGVMELGVIGRDGRLGGRLEREMEVYEEQVKGKRRGYRDRKKKDGEEAQEGEEEEEERGEPSSKKARRMSEDDEDEEERMLEAQLNGTAGGLENGTSSPAGKEKRKVKHPSGGSSAADVKGKAIVDDEGDDEEEEVEDNEADDPDADVDANEGGDEEEEEEEDDEDEADEDDDDDDDDTNDGGVDPEADPDAYPDDVDDARRTNGHRRIGLLPDGNLEMGSEDESD